MVSDAGIWANYGMDAWKSFKGTDRAEKWQFACRAGLTVGLHQVAVALVQRTRPNHVDRKAFYSGHTAHAVSTAHGPLGASIALAVGWGRMAGGWHHGTDVAFGAGAGLFSRWLCDEVIR